ncbi:MAG: hypothetical protein WCP65_00215 [Bacteroidota bacterium]
MKHNIKLHRYLYFVSLSCVITGLFVGSHTILLYATVANVLTGILKEFDNMN